MEKFNVGDKVEVIANNNDGFEVGTKGTVAHDDGSSLPYKIVNSHGNSYWHAADELKLRTSKNQRIKALEETVKHMRAELDKSFEVEQDLLNRISALEFVLAENSKLTTNIKSVPQLNISKTVKTTNQLRAEMIEKAKAFVKKYQTVRAGESNHSKGNGTCRQHYYETEFVVKGNKVTALIRWLSWGKKVQKEIQHVGRAYCSPTDVFNEWIGKAIALGRALNLDVSEFEQAVQPTEVATGQTIVFKEVPSDLYRVDKRNGDLFNFTNLRTNEHFYELEYCNIEEYVTIIDDSNAIYGGAN